jgi:hypothetical protein
VKVLENFHRVVLVGRRVCWRLERGIESLAQGICVGIAVGLFVLFLVTARRKIACGGPRESTAPVAKRGAIVGRTVFRNRALKIR